MEGSSAAQRALLALLTAWLCGAPLASAAEFEDISSFRQKRAADSKGITLTFVFDSTGSMTDELNQVKKAMQDIFDYMKANRADEIANFALVEFNDPHAKLLTITTNANVYRNSLSAIRVTGGGDCPEMAMKGIKIALEASEPNSYLFVFTDASAKDYNMQAEVDNLIQRKKSKVVFVLTGKCSGENEPGYLVYNHVAELSNGQVFNLLKNEVTKVLDFVKFDTGKKGVVSSGKLPGNKKLSINTAVDESMKELTVTVTGKNSDIELVNPAGKREDGKTILNLDSVKSKQVKNPKPGNWTVNVEATTPGRFVITTESSFNFIYGFSLNPTEEMAETAPRPLIGRETALLIQVTNQSNLIHLTDVKIKDTKETVLRTMKLHPVRGKNGTYKAEMFTPPTTVFLLEVSGKDSKHNTIKRVSDSGITPQAPAPPIITLMSELTTTLKSPFTLTCHVESLVPFTASWNKGGVNVMSDKYFSQSAQVLYNISSIQISSGGMYTCKAKNIAGAVSKNVKLNVQVPPPSVKTLKAMELRTNKPGEIPCQVESDVDYTITWTKKTSSGSVQRITGSKFITKPTGNLVILSVEKSDEGEYYCSAKSIFGTGESHVSIEVTEPVQVVAVTDKLKFRSQEHFQLTCTASGSEPISLIWKKNGILIQDSDKRLRRPEKKQLQLKVRYAQVADAGTYECEASNKINKATGTIELKYLERPKVKILPPHSPPLAGTKYIIQCSVSGSPKPTILWTKDDKEILPGKFEQVLPNGTLSIPILFFNHTGKYQCFAENEVGRADAKQNIDVVSTPLFERSKDEFYVDIYKNESIICSVNGYPDPTIKWERDDGKPVSERFSKGSSCSMFLTKAHPEDEGIYVVTATNKFGMQKKVFKIYISGMVKPVLANGSTEELSIAGKQKELTCLIQKGNPSPTLTWYKDGEILEPKDLSLMEGSIFPNGSLIFSYIKPDNEGTYYCEAANVVGKTGRQLNLRVLEAPVFIDDKHVVLKGRIGTSIPLSCEAYGNPKPKITWMKDNKPVIFSPSIALNTEGDILLIMSTTFENSGTYECIAVNTAGRAKKTIDIFVQDAPRISPPSSTDIYIEKGEDLTLICEVQAFPIAEIKWYKNGSPYETTSVSYSENNSSISLTTDLSSSGEYTCHAVNEAGHDKIAVNVTVTVAPIFDSYEEYIHASRGDNVTLSCYTDSVPPADYYWLKYPDEEPRLGDSIITFENVDDSFAGLYRCDVSNIAGDAQKTIVLSIYVPPLILADLPKTQFLRKGTYFSSPCYASGDPHPTVSWLKDGKSLLSLEDSGFLEIKNATEDDAGIYTCVAENYEGTDTKNMQIIVGAPPVMDEVYLKTIEVKEKNSVLVSCPAISGVPTPNVQWLKDGLPLSPTRRVSLKDKNRLLNIKRAKESDEGVYTCVASNSVGEARADIAVHVLIAPRFLNGTANVDINMLQGTTLFFDCSNSGKPTPQVSWYRNNHPFLPILNSRAKFTGPQGTIDNSTQGDKAVYKCIAENKAGSIERTFNVKVFVYAVEEGYIPSEREGVWRPWSPWSSCTAPCGKSERVRFRECSSETATCTGDSEEWEQCIVADCKVDGDWSQWGNWSTCSATCGSGIRFRERFCNNPTPKHGGKICFGANRQHESCNTNPCPVDGSWTTWSAWQTCAGPCSNSTTERTRRCANPIPAFGGKLCSGLKVEYKPCVQETCPVHGGWSEWSPWSPCSATCGHSTSFRERLCNNPKPKLNGLFCSGQSRETRKCDTELCDKIPLHALLLIKGFLNGHNIPERAVNVNVTDMSTERLIEAQSNPLGRKFQVSGLWYPHLSLVISPITWLTAFQKDTAVNGFTLTKGVFKMQTFIKFSSGEEVTIDHVGQGVGPDGVLKLHADIQGRTPLFISGSPVKVEPYQENYIQIGHGELFASSSNTLEGGGLSIPFSWNKTIKYNASLGKLPTLVETLTVKNIKVRRLKQKEEGLINTNPTMTCPKGFKLLAAGFCEDIDECSSRHLHSCHFTQTCENYKGGYACTCPSGFIASTKGGKCTDMDECITNPLICSHKCVNLEGDFKCLCPPGLALLDSKTNCSSILPIKRTKGGEIEDWKHCLPKQIEVDGMCQDENPCKDDLHMCGEGEMCVTMHGLYRCISVPCPPDYGRIKNTKSCIKFCNITTCESGAKVSETVTPIILTPGGPVAPYKDLVHLPLNIENIHLLHTFYQIVENEEGRPFRVKSIEGEGAIYSTTYLPPGKEYRITVLALTYDASNIDILYSNKFTVIIHSPAD